MITEKIKLGQIGEEAAVSFLKKNGYRILEQNFRNKIGEIDIVALENDTLCFIEVKTRNSDFFGSPFESVTRAKQRKISQVALSYLKYKNISDRNTRFDVIAVLLDGDRHQSIEIIKNAFQVN